MLLTLEIKNGKSETITIDDDIYKALVEYAKTKNISIEKVLEIVCTEYAKQVEYDLY